MSDPFGIPLGHPGRTVRAIPDDVLAIQRGHPLLGGLIVRRAGRLGGAPGHRVAHQRPLDEHLIIHCIEGRGWLHLDGAAWTIRRGDVLFALPGTMPAYGADPAEPWKIQWAHFSGADAPGLLALAQVTPAAPVLSLGEQMGIIHLFNAMLDTLDLGYSLHYTVRAAATLRQLLADIAVLNVYAPRRAGTALHVDRIVRYMLDHLGETCRLEDLAAQASLSPSHFARSFRDKTGYPPVEYFIRLRIQRACELLETTDMPIAAVAAALGYADQYYFSRIFRKITGLPPARYRRRGFTPDTL